MAKYLLSNEAKTDLIRIHQYGIVKFGETQADHYFNSFFEPFERIAQLPFSFELVDYIRKGYRRCVCGSDSIYFRVVCNYKKMSTKLRKAFDRFVILEDNEWQRLEEIIIIRKFIKGEYFVRESEICKYVGFIDTGLFRYYYQIDGQQYTRQFFFDNNFMANYESYITNEKSNAWIETLEDATVFLIPRDSLFKLYPLSLNFQKLGRKVAEYLFLTVSTKYKSFLLETAEERYLDLIKNRPKVIQNIPQYIIASYLAITPEGLSRIRKRLHKK